MPTKYIEKRELLDEIFVNKSGFRTLPLRLIRSRPIWIARLGLHIVSGALPSTSLSLRS